MSEGTVIIQVKAIAGAQQLKNSKFKVKLSDNFSRVVTWLQARVKSKDEPGTPAVFVYLKECFMPPFDEKMEHVAKAYAQNGTLTVYYSVKPAWG